MAILGMHLHVVALMMEFSIPQKVKILYSDSLVIVSASIVSQST